MRGQVSPQQPLGYAIDIGSLIEFDHPLREVKRRADQVLSAMDGLIRSVFDRVVEGAYLEKLASGDHFMVDGTLIESYGSMKSFRRKDGSDEKVSDGSDDGDPGSPTVNFRGEKRTNATHQSITDPEARLYREAAGQQSRRCHSVHALMENRNGLLVDVSVAPANGYAEREEALRRVRRTRERQQVRFSTLGADAGYDAGPFLHTLEQEEQIVPNVPTRKGEIVESDAAAQARLRAQERQQHSDGRTPPA